MQPLISIVVVTYKRLDALRTTIESVLSQDYTAWELIIVDNNSGEDIRAFLDSCGCPSIRLIRLNENLGACGGRNAGIRAASGDIIVNLDSDVSFATPSALTEVARTFAQCPEFHVLAFKVCDAGSGAVRAREWCHPRNMREFAATPFETDYFVEGAVAYRREVLDTVGMYDTRLFMCGEGWDLVLRILDRGYRILYAPQVRTTHLMSPEGRVRKVYELSARNYVWMIYKNLPFRSVLRLGLPKLAAIFFYSCRAAELGAFVSGILQALKGIGELRHERAPIGPVAVKHILRLERQRPGVLTRVAQKGMSQL